MIRKSMAGGALLAVCLLMMAAQPASAQAPDGATWFELSTDPPSPPWSVEGVGEETEGFVNVKFCHNAGFNPMEGGITATVTTDSASDSLISMQFNDETELEFDLPPLETQNEQCTSAIQLSVQLKVEEDFGETHDHSFTFGVSGTATGNIGTFQEPEDQEATMQVELELEEPVIPEDETDGEEDDGEEDGDGNVQSEESPGPAFALLAMLTALVVVARRRR